ncbi:DNA polymerase III subunit beta [Thiolapillus sp.]|uniref:DNA polymerase III subunit beta n=1 Tax=Thiolapillus sp. TaxID=2017437 RepID=UPI0025E06902|nr:DNA polymerase III subunit beta [Thiolapillus sp.]
MKITTNRNELLPALLQVSSVVEKRQTLPVLANILFRVEKGMMTLIATDLEVEVKTRISVDAEEDMDFTLPARKIVDICKALGDEAKLELDIQGDKMVLKSGRGRYTLSTLPAADYPNLEAAVATQKITVAQNKLKRLLEKTQFAMAQQDVRYYLNGLLLEGRPGKLRAVATDGHRLALCDLETGTAEDLDIQAIVPRKAVIELNRLLNNTDDDVPEVELQFSSSHMQVEFPNGSFISKLVDGRYPDYAKVTPTANTLQLLADRDLMKGALTRTAILSNEKFRGVRFKVEPGVLHLMAHNPEHEEAEEDLEVEYQGEELTIGFNVSYLLDVLSVLDGDTVNMGLIDATASCLITSNNEDDGARYVVMPMRI